MAPLWLARFIPGMGSRTIITSRTHQSSSRRRSSSPTCSHVSPGPRASFVASRVDAAGTGSPTRSGPVSMRSCGQASRQRTSPASSELWTSHSDPAPSRTTTSPGSPMGGTREGRCTHSPGAASARRTPGLQRRSGLSYDPARDPIQSLLHPVLEEPSPPAVPLEPAVPADAPSSPPAKPRPEAVLPGLPVEVAPRTFPEIECSSGGGPRPTGRAPGAAARRERTPCGGREAGSAAPGLHADPPGPSRPGYTTRRAVLQPQWCSGRDRGCSRRCRADHGVARLGASSPRAPRRTICGLLKPGRSCTHGRHGRGFDCFLFYTASAGHDAGGGQVRRHVPDSHEHVGDGVHCDQQRQRLQW